METIKPRMRKSNFELLRIISMFSILMTHMGRDFGIYKLYDNTIGLNKLVAEFLHTGGKIGVACFILISGYFMVEKTITLKRILKLAGEVWFYSIAIWLVWIIIKSIQGGLGFVEVVKETVHAFFPLTLNHYWFITAYVILLILSPFLNKLIFSLDYKGYTRFLIVLIIILVIMIGGFPHLLPHMIEGRFAPMILYYFIAGYLKRFRTEMKNNASKHIAVGILFYCLLLVVCSLISFVGVKVNNSLVLDNMHFYWNLKSPLVIVASVEFFIGFSELKIKYNKVINTIASCTLGVYLLHENRILGTYLSNAFSINKETRPGHLLLYSMLTICVLYIIFSLIDLLRQLTVEKLWFSFLNKHLDSIQAKVMRVIRKIAGGVKKIGRAYYGE